MANLSNESSVILVKDKCVTLSDCDQRETPEIEGQSKYLRVCNSMTLFDYIEIENN